MYCNTNQDLVLEKILNYPEVDTQPTIGLHIDFSWG
jgi:hypothetical protein